MEGKGLPFFGPSVEFSSVPPIETKRILSYFNQFVSNSVQLLNKFAVICDTKLVDLDFRLQDIEATLAILEAKLASIPSLESTAVPALPPLAPTTSSSSTPSSVIVPIPPPVPSGAVHENVSDVHQTAVVPPSNPEILRFVKMLAVGVPLMAVEQKMRAEGYDPSLLNSARTDAAKVPAPARSNHSSSDNEESNSDEY
ncbi:WASH complex subunit 3-like [Daphnia carinata]|uniref:WASH complex subunit 3-like n=1 Tax=Daphnia carinata TaxID=120202 RepID=UPI00257A1871|nr:WASH complex subunit 3-like [Daphnia carinata]